MQRNAQERKQNGSSAHQIPSTNAWLGKITCERLHNGLDTTADKSAHFASVNLPRGATTVQSYQFLAAAIGTYCPDQVPVLTAAAARHQ